MNQHEPTSRRDLVVGGAASLALLALSWWWLGYVARAEGAWVVGKLGTIKSYGGHVIAVLFGGCYLGFAAGYLRLRAWRTVVPVAATGVFAWILFYAFNSRDLEFAPDWVRILSVLLGGAACGAVYSLTARVTGNQPIWTLFAPFALLGVAAAIFSGSLADFAGVVCLLFLADALGRFVFEKVVPAIAPASETAPFFLRAGTGLAVIIAIFRVVGLCGGASRFVQLAGLIILAFLLRRQLVASGTDLIRTQQQARFTLKTADGMILGLGFSLALVLWLSVLAPEMGPDALGGRTALPVMWAHSGQITGAPEIALSYMGIGGETLNLVALPFAGDNVAKVTTFLTGVLLTGAFVWFAGKSRVVIGVLAAIAFFSSTTVWWHFTNGFVDLPMAFFCVASLGAWMAWQAGRNSRWLVIAGFLGGTAAGIKLNGGAVLAAMTPLIALLAVRRDGAKGLLRDLGGIIGGFLAAFAVPAIRSAYLTGNPVFPFANGLFRSPFAEIGLTAKLYGAGLNHETWLLPFSTVLRPASFGELGTYHPLIWLVVLGSLAMAAFSSSSIRLTWIAVGIMWLAWIMTEENLRYSLPAFACTLAVAAGTFPEPKFSWMSWANRTLRSQLFLAAGGIAIFGGVALNLSRPTAWMWGGGSGAGFPFRFITGAETAKEFLSLRLPSANLAEVLNARTVPTTALWQVPWTRDHLYFQARTVAHPHGDPRILNPLRQLLPDYPKGMNPAAIHQALLAAHFSDVMWDDNNPWTPKQPESAWPGLFAPEFTRRYLVLEAADRGLRLFHLRPVGQADPEKENFAATILTARTLGTTAGQLVGISVAWPEPILAGAYVDLAWYSADNRLLLYDRLTLCCEKVAGFQRRWQTAPISAHELRIFPSPSAAALQLTLLSPSGEKAHE